jgi:serine/threonine protein kinase
MWSWSIWKAAPSCKTGAALRQHRCFSVLPLRCCTRHSLACAHSRALVLRSGAPLSEAAAARAVADVADALRYCHWQGVCHGDVKPENMLSGADGRVRLTDFSVSQARVDAAMQLGHAISADVAFQNA